MKTVPAVVVSFRLSPAELKQLKEVARKRRMKVTALIKLALKQTLVSDLPGEKK